MTMLEVLHEATWLQLAKMSLLFVPFVIGLFVMAKE